MNLHSHGLCLCVFMHSSGRFKEANVIGLCYKCNMDLNWVYTLVPLCLPIWNMDLRHKWSPITAPVHVNL